MGARRSGYAHRLSLVIASAALVALVVLPQVVSARPVGAVLATTATPEASLDGAAGTNAAPGSEPPPLSERVVAQSPEAVLVPTPPSTVSVAPTPSPSPSPLPSPAAATPSPGPRATHKPAVATSRRTAVFLGDSYTSGYAGAGSGSLGWPALVAKAQGWRVVNLAVPGTGFVNPGWTGEPVWARVAAAIRAKPSVVVLAAGHNDSRWSRARIAAAAERVIDRLHRSLPKATIVIVGPIWPSGGAPARAMALRDHLRNQARDIGAVFIDPIAGGWFAGANHRLIRPDGIHPTDSGHRHIADEVLAALAAAGVP